MLAAEMKKTSSPTSKIYEKWAICKAQITTARFPTLQAPTGGCVRYYRGIDMTGVVTELHFYFKDGFRTACDCAAKCLERSDSCNNWVWKHTFMEGDSGRRSCTLYSSPNLPSNVTLAYNLANSSGFEPLDPANNPQAGGPSPLTFLDANMTVPDPFGVSGFTAIDQNGALYC
ncbi:hypothetical protein MAC_05723 [Metarhizium acridum CQMa 102]|uniref:Apple domain-containing protein n=1 Tax=Metarhizium acridum (strain CQMa 102) TaxID=655827 RepID=E9E775_METAQ|nr:uncharacterized protein MAC_05723 [Metarhizium acridum CQMa 102]EFY88250.1 hypothetical protein MAC_05723 [Metarhizium acridum CQMa 102]